MNHIYKVIFNKATGTFVAVSEFAKGHSKSTKSASVNKQTTGIGKITTFALSTLTIAMMANPAHATDRYVKDETGNQWEIVNALEAATLTFVGANGVSTTMTGDGTDNTMTIGIDTDSQDFKDAVAAATPKKLNYFHVNNSDNQLTASGTNNLDTVDGHGSATGPLSLAAGARAEATLKAATAVGHSAKAKDAYTTATGAASQATKLRATATGSYSQATELNATATGAVAKATEQFTTATGSFSKATKLRATATGSYSVATAPNSTATGAVSRATKSNTTAIGAFSKAIAREATAIGHAAQADKRNSIALGRRSLTDSDGQKISSATVGATTYSGFAGYKGVATGDVLAVGRIGEERQIINLAPGEISKTSTDAINGSQLYSVAKELDRKNYFHTNTGNYNGSNVVGGNSATANATVNNLGNVDDAVGATAAGSLTAGEGALAVVEAGRPEYVAHRGTAVGYNARTSGKSVAVGANTYANGYGSVLVGADLKSNSASALGADIGSADNVLVGNNMDVVEGSNMVLIGNNRFGPNKSGKYKGSFSTFIGAYAGTELNQNPKVNELTIENSTFLGGRQAGAYQGYDWETQQFVDPATIGGKQHGNVGIGSWAANKVLGNGNIAVGDGSGSEVKGGVNAVVGVWAGRKIVGDKNAAFGNAAGNNVQGDKNTAMGTGSGRGVRGDFNSALGSDAGLRAHGNRNTATGYNSGGQLTGDDNLSSGAFANTVITGVNANGKATMQRREVSRTASLGAYSLVANDDAVALGSYSVADRAALTVNAVADINDNPAGDQVFALSAASDADKQAIANTVVGNLAAVSVGAATRTIKVFDEKTASITEVEIGASTRQITNVAAGRDDSDAVNVAQLKSVANSGWNLQETGTAVDEVKNGDTVNFVASVNGTEVASGATGPFTVSNESDEKLSKIAYNFNYDKNVFEVNDNGELTLVSSTTTVTDTDDQSTGGGGTITSTGGTGGDLTINAGKNLVADAIDNPDAITISTAENVEFTEVKVGDTINITKDGIDMGDTSITNVADGVNDGDVVNVSQLKASKEVVQSDDKSVTVETTQNADGANVFDLSVNTDDTTITKDPNTGAITAVTSDITTNTDDSVDAGSNPDGLATAGDVADAINNSGFTAGNTNTDTLVTENSKSTVINPGDTLTVEAGKNLSSSFDPDTGLLQLSTKDDVDFNSVTVGKSLVVKPNANIDMGGNQIHNIAPGTKPTDAVNVSQLQGTTQNLYNAIGDVRDGANAGTATGIATANLPQPHDPGKSMVAAGVGYYEGEAALAVGLSSISDNGRWVMKGSLSVDTQSNAGVGAAVGYQW